VTTRERYVVAARIQGTVLAEDLLLAMAAGKDQADPAEAEDGKAGPKENKIDVVVVSDIDWIAPIIFQLREMGENQDMMVDWKFQNVTMVLNILDSLAGDDRFLAIRKRTRPHRILTKIEEATEDHRTKFLKDQEKFMDDASAQIDTVRDEFRKKMAEVESRTDLDPRMKAQVLEMQRIQFERQRDVQIARLEKQRDQQVKQIERELAAKIRGVQDFYKLCAVLLPPIPPVLLAFFVFFHRRRGEQEGVDTRRLRYGRTKDAA
jgi:ABC-2 type transport system permease protein